METTNSLATPTILFKKEVYEKWKWLVGRAPGEISVLGAVELKNGVFTIGEIFLLEQTNSGAHTEIDAAALAQFLTQKQIERYDISKLRCHLHSHVNFGVFWSATDVENIKRYAGSAPWLLSMVFNKQGEAATRLDIFTPVHVVLKAIEWKVDEPPPPPDPRHDHWELEYTEKTKHLGDYTAKARRIPYTGPSRERNNGKSRSAFADYEELTSLKERIRGEVLSLEHDFESQTISHAEYAERFDELQKRAKEIDRKLEEIWSGQTGIFD